MASLASLKWARSVEVHGMSRAACAPIRGSSNGGGAEADYGVAVGLGEGSGVGLGVGVGVGMPSQSTRSFDLPPLNP